ncbi:thermophilic metalloprotease (M29) superfamily [Candidatus Beckwithbacteria bacterium RBG_13_42_9]|uniref:Thermophilic metalloprotease (M29) superfamily n=1 Tax=Candidatus Beckwithbacteria bacterium RBG_13_42_9 TaxID=1797457 RepID=A0A1F5E556_9BACT|nr:MAG: thermophilic metalloprotease (M29) superfamily [Candidatus Beckwithbacteria bacterium RBG_13_42_9]
MKYQPSQKILEKYADVLVNFALGSGQGIKKGEVVELVVWEAAKPFYIELRKAILKSGGHIISRYQPDDDQDYNPSRDFYELASSEQLRFLPGKYLRGLVRQVDHSIIILSETNKLALEGIDPKKIMTVAQAIKPYRDWLQEKENKGKYTWTIAAYATHEMAKHADLTLKEYWQQLIKGCYLNETDPVKEWQKVYQQISHYQQRLNSLSIEKIHAEGVGIDLWLTLGKKRRWMGGSGRNVPSFEIFTSPDWRGTEGKISFNQPLYRNEHLITGIELEFKKGKIVKYKARRNQKYLQEMIRVPGADRVGEFSLTDTRFSRITKFMAETLFDENMGGKEGNTHIALGMAFPDCYNGNPNQVSKKEWRKLGFNDSAIHADIISTDRRRVTAYLKNGTKKVIYREGKFVI